MPGVAAAALGGLVATAVGVRETPGTADAQLGSLVGTAVGVRETAGTAAASLGGLVGTVAGARETAGTAAASLGPLVGTAVGVRTVTGTADAQLGALTATIAGVRETTGTAAAALGGLAAVAAGAVGPIGVAQLGAVTATATGVRETTGTGLAALSGITATVVGVRETAGTAAASLGGLVGTVAGVAASTGTAAASLGPLVGTAVGVRETAGSASAALGGLTATTTAGVARLGVAVAPLGGITATAVGVRAVTGTGLAAFGALTGIAAGVRTTTGTAAASLGGLVGAAAGITGQVGIAAATLGGLTATVVGTRTVYGVGGVSLGGLTASLRGLAAVFGQRVSPPLAIPDGPIVGSRVWWTATTPGASQVLIETSVDAGATWQTAVPGGPVPRMARGDTRTARTVLTRATLTRAMTEDETPRLHRLEVEVVVDSSIDEVVPVGVFTLNDVEIDDSGRGLTIELAGADLARRVSRNRWDDTYIVAEGTNYATAIQDMIRNRLPDTVFNFASTPLLTPRLFFGEQSSNDPWTDAQDMAVAIGHELFFDARGICTLRPEPDPDVGESVWEFEDLIHPTMIDLARRVTDESTYNKVVVTGETSSNAVPVRAVAIDDDPASPTYYLGPYGTVTYRRTSPLVLTTAQAQESADALLRRVKGATEAVEMSVVPMPAVEPGDVVSVTRGRSKVEGRFIVDQLRVPLGAGEAMRVVGRRQRQ